MKAQWTRIGAYVLCRDPDGRILLTRFEAKGHPDSHRWTLPGGGLEWDESAEAAAAREFVEETGLTAQLGSVLGIYSRWYTADEAFLGEPGHHLGVVFSATSFAGELRTDFTTDNSTGAAQWFSPDEMQEIPLVPLADFAFSLLR